MSFNSLLNTKVNILRVTNTTGALGCAESVNVLHHNLKCRLVWKKGSQKIFFNKDTYFRDGKLYCNVIDVTTEDRVQYGAKIYDIVDVDNTHEMGHHMALTLKIVE